jgi:hypothetical protein
MVKKLAVIAVVVVAGCHPLPELRSHELPEHPPTVERKPLTVPHRDWLEQGCWVGNDHGHDVKVCK